MVEIAKAVSFELRCPDHGRADLGADRKEVTHLFTIIRDAALAGQRHHLHHPQDERAVRDRRRVSVFRDGKYIGTSRPPT
jgi:ABC-type sugar transport system ATPase subunit